MTIYTAENDSFTLGVKEMGAELCSLQSKKTGEEYIWCGNPDIWYGQSPILFPIVGRLLDDKYRFDGKEYTMPKHGLVRKKPFCLTERTKSSLTFTQTDDEESRISFPFSFALRVKFELSDKGLTVTHTVENRSDREMPFSLGAHPAFCCETGDRLEFPNPQTLSTERIDHDSILIDEHFPLLNKEKSIRITKEIFEPDALILSGYTDREISLRSDRHNRIVRFLFDSPLLGIWAKPGAPYVCIEPWWGVNDSRDKKADIREKREILTLSAGASRAFSWEAQIIE